MPPAVSRLQVFGLKEAIARVDEVGERARRPEPALRSPRVLFALQESERRKFATGRFRRDSKAWVDRKRKLGLSTRTMVASGRLKAALENATPPVRRTVFNSMMTWGIPNGRSDLYYASIQAHQGRRAVVVDPIARESIAGTVQEFLAYGSGALL